ncbi:uncharacterized protein LOC119524992 [Choloepus didactylus]|uniref:uncharacterized protein LOC119524992 n=1 Tax=Choloepus didactylus TaxID=27675 RepID=UPI00189CCB2D|nr:uncharacterized protein LOC119524992 [Choloepus didactylus]
MAPLLLLLLLLADLLRSARLCSTRSPLGAPERAHGPDQCLASGRELAAIERSPRVCGGDCSDPGLRRLPCGPCQEERSQETGAGRGLGEAAPELHLPLGSPGTEARAAARPADTRAGGSARPSALGLAPGSPGGERGGRSQTVGPGPRAGSKRAPGHGAAGKMTAGSCALFLLLSLSGSLRDVTFCLNYLKSFRNMSAHLRSLHGVVTEVPRSPKDC